MNYRASRGEDRMDYNREYDRLCSIPSGAHSWQRTVEIIVLEKCPNCKHRLYKEVTDGCSWKGLEYTPKED